MDNKKKGVMVLNFGDHEVPEYKELAQTAGTKRYIAYGKDNKFAHYLLNLFECSPKHGAIIKGKAKYVAGKGLEFKDKTNEKYLEALKTVNRNGEHANKIVKKMALDQEIFNGYFLQIVYGKGGMITDIIHLEHHKCRSNYDNSKFFYRENWLLNRGDIKEFDCFNPDNRTGSQVLYSKAYYPGVCTYTLPEYIGAKKYIESDILVSDHVMNNAKSGFTGSKMIVFTDGEPTTDEQQDIEKRINDKFSGAKGSKIVISFVNGSDKAPQVSDLGVSDLTKEDFAHVDELISQNIFTGHQVVSPMLFGVRVAGQLGGRNEMREAYEILMNTYVNARQQDIEEVLNGLLQINGLPEIKITPCEPIGYDISEIKDFVPKAYILEKLGVNPNDYPPDEQPAPAPGQQPASKQEFSEDDDSLALELFSQTGDPREGFIRVRSKKVEFSSDLECLKSEAQAYREAFAEVTQLESNILDLLKKDKRATAQVIAKALKVDVDLVKGKLNDLSKKGLVDVSTETLDTEKTTVREVTQEGKQAVAEKRPMTTEVFIKYSYEGPKDDRNRAFCAKLLELDRIYSRAEIESISQRLGYSVWERRGGFYHNPKTNTTTPYCRHHWSQHIVIKKK